MGDYELTFEGKKYIYWIQEEKKIENGRIWRVIKMKLCEFFPIYFIGFVEMKSIKLLLIVYIKRIR